MGGAPGPALVNVGVNATRRAMLGGPGGTQVPG